MNSAPRLKPLLRCSGMPVFTWVTVYDTVEACVSEAKKDVATATSLMESRLLSGRKEMMLGDAG